ncbi:MAG: OmpH family outer membrane protein [Ignavibacteriales bacterium]|nr:OmpH family outer membrane protein [Ignavibacteriaceae bacterium]NLH60499.1 OmpH family outer membrane protein [Ignavibacteriales bacterium]HPO54899.1 OmpH family outer membrane protein [Ignavibacteriaceae bacterium]
MKKYLFILTLVFLTTASFAQTSLKIGYVDSEVILKQLPEAIKAQGELDALINKWNDQIDSMGMALQTAYADYQKQMNTMPEAKKQEAQQKLVAQQQIVEEFRRSKFAQGTGEIYKKQEELLKPVKDKIFATIEIIAKEESMQFVFDKSGDIILLYADSAFDITYKVLDRLKRGKN